MRSRGYVLIGVLAGVVVSGGLGRAQSGPAPAQIQAALRAFAANATFGTITVTGSCNGCSGTDFLIQSQGGPSLPARAILNFTGAGISAADDSVDSRTNVTLAAVGSDTQVQFNDAGSFAGTGSLNWNKTTGGLSSGVLPNDSGFAPDVRDFYGYTGQINSSSATVTAASAGGLSILQQGNASQALEGASILAANSGAGNINALDVDAVYVGTDTLGNAIGLNILAWNDSTTGTITNAQSIRVLLPSNANGGFITNGEALRIHAGGSTNITNGYGINIDGAITGTNSNAIHIADQGTGVNAYAIKVDGGKSSFGGAISTGGSGLTVANVGANSCGTTAATIAGNDNAFTITVGATAGTQCRVTFPNAAANQRECAANDETTTIAVRSTYVDTTHTDLLGAFVAGDKVSGVCFAR